jgi:hypothetical protein
MTTNFSTPTLFVEKRNTINQKWPLMFVILKWGRKNVTVQDKGKSRKAECIKVEDFNARFVEAAQ